MKNPFARRWLSIAQKYTDPRKDPAQLQMARIEAQQAEDAGTETCGNCGGIAYYRPGVGAWQCVTCNALRNYQGVWVGGQPPQPTP